VSNILFARGNVKLETWLLEKKLWLGDLKSPNLFCGGILGVNRTLEHTLNNKTNDACGDKQHE
jgi:hypothetical protein